MKSIFPVVFLCLFSFIVGCSDDKTESLPVSNDLSRMSAEERKANAPNEAFEAVYKRSLPEVQTLLDDNPELFLIKNDYGRTPLMVSISLDEQAASLAIAKKLDASDLKATDAQGRGVLSYASQHGFTELIRVVGDTYKGSLSWGLSRFFHIDPEDKLGRRSLFYAADSSTAEVLKTYWMQWKVSWGLSWTFFSGFYNAKDLTGKNFLHTAAIDNRFDLINWGMGEVCDEPLFHNSNFLFGVARGIGKGVDFVSGAIQRAPVVPADLVNGQDDEGNTPLHLATRNGSAQASQSLMSCRFVNYRAANNFGRNPLAEMLAHIDVKKPEVAENYKKIFNALITKENYISWANNFIPKMVNDKDENGYSALHYAARLQDPYFYLALEKIGDVDQEDDKGQTPRSLFHATHK